MNMQLSKTPIGLDGVPAAETVLSHVDGERGELIIGGERVGDLVLTPTLEGGPARPGSAPPAHPVAGPPAPPPWGKPRHRPLPRLPNFRGSPPARPTLVG